MSDALMVLSILFALIGIIMAAFSLGTFYGRGKRK